MMRTISFRPEAQDEFIDSRRFYEERNPAVRSRFERAIEAKLQSIVENPDLYPIVEGDMREATLARFPYTTCFRVTDDEVRVMSVFHHSRDPATWQSRREET
jgi:plasmid stabilization system protein ParE